MCNENTMNKTWYLILFVFGISACTQNNKLMNAKVLTYTTNVEILNDSFSQSVIDYFSQKYGDSVEVTYDSRGNIRMDYFGSGDMGMSYNFYNARLHQNYSKSKNLDTIYFYDTSINNYRLDSTERISNEHGFILKYYSQDPYDSTGIIQEFHFLYDSLIVNPELYKDFNDFSFCEIIADSKCLPIKTIVTNGGIRITRNLFRTRPIVNPNLSFFEPEKGIELIAD